MTGGPGASPAGQGREEVKSALKKANEATALTFEVMADPKASFAERYAAAWEEQKAIEAWRNQPEINGAHPELGAGLTDMEAGQ